MFYAAQVWGFQKHDEVERLLRFFIKKMLYLPDTTPNYMLHLETGFNSLYLDTLKMHFNYITKVMNMNPNRLPRILASYIITNKLCWATEWNNLGLEIQMIPDNTSTVMRNNCRIILNRLKIEERREYIASASRSQFHDLYPQLDLNVTPILARNYSTRCTSLIIKARGGMLDLNARTFRNNTTGICAICNMDETENTFHFIGVCPIYKSYRRRYFGKDRLEKDDVLRLLNGSNFNHLFKYLEISLKYRKLIINEFMM